MNQPQIEKYSPGTVLPVGSHQVKVLKYLASGGYAHVYSVEISPPDPVCPDKIACLKRVVVPNKASLNTLRAEVDTMKTLRGNKCIVSYIDSHATKSPVNPGMYEVYLLMELCSGGGLIDFMNTRLQNRLQEFEVLNIMSQVSQGIAAMHALQPPLIHRDIKIENVLISKSGDFKVCDFGSVSGVIRAPRNTEEFNYVQHDIMKNTTAQYRSPEMIDLYRGLPIDEKSDIWALGVFLYKICYYTTPFEKEGESAILASRFQFPAYPQYSDRVKNLVSVMLRTDPLKRPNICQVLEEVSRIQGKPCPLKNFYLTRMMTAQKEANATPPPVSIVKEHSQVHLLSNSQPGSVKSLSPAPQISSSSYSNNVPIMSNPDFSSNAPKTESKSSYRAASNYSLPDPFARIDKSSLLAHSMPAQSVSRTNTTPQLQYQTSQVQYQPNILSRTHSLAARSSVSPVRNGHPAISSIAATNRTSIEKPKYVDSETQTTDILLEPGLYRSLSRRSAVSRSSSSDSLDSIPTGGSFSRKMDSLAKSVTGEKRGFSPIRSAQNTGDSVRSAFSALRRGISSMNFTGENKSRKSSQENRTHRHTSNSQVSDKSDKNIRPHRRSTSSYSLNGGETHDLIQSHNNERKPASIRRTSSMKTSASIQKRVNDLINAKDVPTKNTASGYGQYTEPDSGSGSSESRHSTRKSSTVITPVSKAAKLKPAPPPKPAHLKPQLPPKPQHLKSSSSKTASFSSKRHYLKVENDSQTDEIQSQDLTKDFERRFPSAL